MDHDRKGLPTKLVFIAGPPGVGKTTATADVHYSLESSAWLEADDVFRIRPWVIDDKAKALVEGNIVAVLSAYLAAEYEHVLLSWVLHRRDLVERLCAGIGREPDLVISLVCTPEVLVERLRKRGSETLIDHALRRLEEVRESATCLLDTTERSPGQVAGAIRRRIRALHD